MTSQRDPLGRVAVVTGGSSGIGAATASALAAAGFEVVIGARRADRLAAVADATGARALTLDVTDPASVAAFCEQLDRCDVLVNNAGGALGLDRIEDTDVERLRAMFETNVVGTLRMTQALLPRLVASGDGVVVCITSIAGWETYPGGAGYNAAKFGQRAVTEVLRQELLGQPVRVCEVAPGLVETEFALVRFGGDQTRAARVYEGMTPLTAADVADCIAFAVTRPPHVNIDHLRVMARDQYGARQVHRTA